MHLEEKLISASSGTGILDISIFCPVVIDLQPPTLYFLLLESTLPYHGSTSLYHGFTPLHFTMVLFYSTWLFFTLPLVYFTLIHFTMALLDCTSLYYGSRPLQFIVPWLYWILFYCLHVSRDHRNVAWHWTQLGCAKRFILYVSVFSLLHSALWLLWVLSTA